MLENFLAELNSLNSSKEKIYTAQSVNHFQKDYHHEGSTFSEKEKSFANNEYRYLFPKQEINLLAAKA